MTRVALDAVTINDTDIGSLPTVLTDLAGNQLGPASLTPLAAAAQTANGQSGSLTVSNYRSLLLFLNVTAVSGTTPTLNVFVDVQGPDGVWYQLAQLGPANIAAVPTYPPSGYTLALGRGTTAGDFGSTLRIRWVIAGTTPSFTFGVTAVAKP